MAENCEHIGWEAIDICTHCAKDNIALLKEMKDLLGYIDTDTLQHRDYCETTDCICNSHMCTCYVGMIEDLQKLVRRKGF